jgi:hypothetical protein
VTRLQIPVDGLDGAALAAIAAVLGVPAGQITVEPVAQAGADGWFVDRDSMAEPGEQLLGTAAYTGFALGSGANRRGGVL